MCSLRSVALDGNAASGYWDGGAAALVSGGGAQLHVDGAILGGHAEVTASSQS